MCQQYWPPLGCKMMIGDFSISCNAEKKYIGFMKRTLSFTRPPGGSRQVIQLHYSEWTRNALPSDLSTLAIFMEIIQCKRQTPILVHCRLLYSSLVKISPHSLCSVFTVEEPAELAP